MVTIDNDTFRELNGNALVYPGKANYWVIVARRADLLKMPESKRLEEANQVAADFMHQATLLATPELRALDVWPADGVPKGKRYGLVQPQPMVYPEGCVYVSLTWDAPEDSVKEIPWPWLSGLTGDGDWQDVWQGLVAVFQPGAVVTVPSALDNAVYAAQQTVEQAAGELPKIGKDMLLWAAVGAASIFALSRALK